MVNSNNRGSVPWRNTGSEWPQWRPRGFCTARCRTVSVRLSLRSTRPGSKAVPLTEDKAWAHSETTCWFCEVIFLNKKPFSSLVQRASSHPAGCSGHLHPAVRQTQSSSRFFLSHACIHICMYMHAVSLFIFHSIQSSLSKISLAHVSLLQTDKSLEFDMVCNFLRLIMCYLFGREKPV